MSERTISHDKWLAVRTQDDLVKILPEELVTRMGEGEVGYENTYQLLVNLVPFAPEPATFDRMAFDAVVPYSGLGEKLPPEQAQTWFDVAVEAGFVKKVTLPNLPNVERLTVSGAMQEATKRVFPE